MKRIWLFILILFSATTIFAQPAPASNAAPSGNGGGEKNNKVMVPAEKARPISIPKLETPPVIDGKMDEAVWQQAAVFQDFYQTQPGDNIAPSKPTIAYLAYDSRTLYLAFHCFDDPDKIRATVAARDQIFGEDNIRVYLDTFNDQRRAYLLGWNAFGIQADGLYNSTGNTDFSVDIVMESKGSIVSDGWVVEVAIPFKSLRYEAGEGKQWGFHIWRNIDRFNDEIDSWVPISRDKVGLLNQAGHITGLSGISTERTLEIIPTVKFSEDGARIPTRSELDYRNNPDLRGLPDAGRFRNYGVKGEFGLTAKFSFTPNITLDAAYNPDFADVEADQTVLQANQRFPIFFPERRPFFLEGKDIFETSQQILNTRTIADPDVALKLSGKTGRTLFGVLFASDNAPGGSKPASDNNALVGALRLKRDIGPESTIGFMATMSRFSQARPDKKVTIKGIETFVPNGFIRRDNYVASVDGRLRFGAQRTLNFQLTGSNSNRCFFDPGFNPDANSAQAALNREDCNGSYNFKRNGNGVNYNLGFNQSGRHFSWNYNAQGRNNDYRADVGFVRRRNTNYQGTYFNYNSEPNPKAKLISWRVGGGPSVNFDWQGRLQNWDTQSEFNLRFKRNAYAGGGFNSGYERIFEGEFGPRNRPGRTNLGFARNAPERSLVSKSFYTFVGANPSKKYSYNFVFGYDWSTFDFDFGNDPKYARASPGVLAGTDFRQDPGPGNNLFLEAELELQPTDELSFSLSWNHNKLRRQDTGRVAFNSHIYSLRSTYQFTRFVFARARVDYDSLGSSVSGQYLFGWTPKPGTSFFVGYNNDLNFRGYNYLNGRIDPVPEPGFRRNGQTFFIKLSYLFRKSFGG